MVGNPLPTSLHAGVDTSVIALWLGHEKTDTVQIYLHADLRLKERALARTTPLHAAPGRYQPPDTLLAFLEALRLCRVHGHGSLTPQTIPRRPRPNPGL